MNQSPTESHANEPTLIAPAEPARINGEAMHQLNVHQTGLLGSREVYALRRQHMELSAGLMTRLSLFMRAEIAFDFSELSCTTLKQWVEGMMCPTHLTLFKVEPLSGIFMLEIPPLLGMTMVDRLMGGPGEVNPPDSRLSEIETALLDEVVQIILSEWVRMWADVQPLHPVLLGHEIDARSLMHAPHDSALLAVSFTARIGKCQDHFRFGIPYATMGGLIQQLSQKLGSQGQRTAADVKWSPVFDDIPVEMQMVHDGIQLPAAALGALRIGDTLPLDPNWFRNVQVCLADQPRFHGHLGTRNEKWAVELTKLLENNA